MPESSTPGNFSGGNVTGTRMTELKIPALPSQCQNGVPLRIAFDLGLAERNGIFADLDMTFRPLDFRRRKKRQIVLQIARQKIVDVVLARD